jgi:hypothetical protein
MPKRLSESEKRRLHEKWSEIVTGTKDGLKFNPNDPVFDSDPEIEYSKEFTFDGFSIIYQHGMYYAEYPDADGNPQRHPLFSKRSKKRQFPYTFIVEGKEKKFTEQDFTRMGRK